MAVSQEDWPGRVVWGKNHTLALSMDFGENSARQMCAGSASRKYLVWRRKKRQKPGNKIDSSQG